MCNSDRIRWSREYREFFLALDGVNRQITSTLLYVEDDKNESKNGGCCIEVWSVVEGRMREVFGSLWLKLQLKLKVKLKMVMLSWRSLTCRIR